MNIKKILPLFILLFLFGCAAPSPLYGTWSDNRGDKITFVADNTYTAQIKDKDGKETMHTGSYSVQINAMTFFTEAETVVTEWDIRGNMLYLTWTTAEGDSINLTLYKTA